MHLFIRRLRALFTLILLAIFFVCLAAPWFYLIILRDGLGTADEREHRARLAEWQCVMGRCVLAIVRFGMGIKLVLDLPEPLPAGPYLIVSNHLGGFDGFLIISVLWAIGRLADLRAIGKSQAAFWPIVGRAWKELGWGFVLRTRDRNDYDAVLGCGRLAMQDGADVLIFVEGTSFKPKRRKPGFTYVLPPKPGGLRVLHRLMPERPILNLTIGWELESHGHALADGCIPYGRQVTVLIQAVTDLPENVEPWLQAEWQRKDAWIAANG